MSDLGKLFRQKRFNIRAGSPITLVIETHNGTPLKLGVTDCSLTGISAFSDEPIAPELIGGTHAIIPSSKLLIDDKEVSTGRLVVRRVVASDKRHHIAFSTIDSRIPVDGVLSKYVDAALDDLKNPYEFELSSDNFSPGTFRQFNHLNTDLFLKAQQFKMYCNDWFQSSTYQFHNVRLPSQGERILLKQTRDGTRNDYLVMCSNDYLGLSAHPEVKEAAKKAIDDYGFGSTGSPVTTGITQVHEELTETVARIFNKESAILFNSGYAANIGVLTGLTTASDLIVSDIIAHASIQDGMQMAQANKRFFKHNDPEHLEKVLKENREAAAGCLVVTEGVFSMDGDTPPINELLSIARKYNARTMIDEAHSFGVVGNDGLGLWTEATQGPPDIIMGTFSKICGGIGGFIATDKAVVDWLHVYARSQMFSVSIPPSTAAAALTALRIFKANPQLITRLQANIRHFVNGLRRLGCPLPSDHRSAVVPVVIGDERTMGKMNEIFRKKGIYAIPIMYPAVSKSNCRFRFTIMAGHSISDLDYALNVIEVAMEKAGFNFEKERPIAPAKKAA